MVEEAWQAADKTLSESPAKNRLKKLANFLVERTL
jgi:geranylgeranyl pyrophosphate synthase